MSNFRTLESTASHRARSPFHCSKISSFWTRLTETLPPLRGGAVQLPRCIVRARESTRGPLFRSKKFKRSYMSFFRTRTTRRFVFPFPACAFAGLYIVRAVKTTRTNTKDPAGGIYGHRDEEEEALFHSEKFHSLKRTMYFCACIETTRLELRVISLHIISSRFLKLLRRDSRVKSSVQLWRDVCFLRCTMRHYRSRVSPRGKTFHRTAYSYRTYWSHVMLGQRAFVSSVQSIFGWKDLSADQNYLFLFFSN